jgi:uncharacterized RDD family membrane protein YckC
LIEFPRRPRTTQTEPAEASLPAWRIELNEKVRARKAKQSSADEIIDAEPAETDVQIATPVSAPPRETRAASIVSPDREPPLFFSDDIYPRRRRTEVNPRSFPSASLQTASSNNPIVQAALSRARRASENASRAALPRIESRPLPSASKNSFAIDREATARVLEAPIELGTLSSAPVFLPEPPANPVTQPKPVEQTVTPRIIVPATPIIDEEPVTCETESPVEPRMIEAIDELDPCDYLEAEVRRVDKALSAEFSRNESPSLGMHVVINVIDLVVIAASCVPFLAAIALSNGSFASIQTRAVMIGVFAIVSLFYLCLTHCFCGRTVGMMITNTRIVDVGSFENPPRTRAFIRALGYFVAAAPAMIGLFWMAGNRKRRGWHDFISGTFVARDF